jgi:hypothetical protein
MKLKSGVILDSTRRIKTVRRRRKAVAVAEVPETIQSH